MPFPVFQTLGKIDSLEELTNEIAKMQKYLQWLLQSLDTLNVKQLSADVINTGILNADLVQILSDASGLSIDSSGLVASFGATTRVEINESGITVYEGALKVYDDTGTTTLIDGGTFYGDNIIITGNILIGKDIYMNADYLSGQTRYIYPDKNTLATCLVFDMGSAGPRMSFINFDDVYVGGKFTVGGMFDATYAYENGARLATQDWVSANFAPPMDTSTAVGHTH